MTRYYYNSQIKALYMMEEFGFGINLETKHTSRADGRSVFFKSFSSLWVDGADCDQDSIRVASLLHTEDNDITRANNKIYLTERSEYIINPKEGDIGILLDGKTLVKYILISLRGEQFGWSYLDGRPFLTLNENVKIIMRDNKQFFMPEVEYEEYQKRVA